MNAASTGLAVAAARRARPLKPKLGPLAYAIGGTARRPHRRGPSRHVNADGGRCSPGGVAVIVGRPGAFGGGSGIEEADPATTCSTSSW